MNKIIKSGLQLKWLVQFILVFSPVIYMAVFYWQGSSTLLHLPESISFEISQASLVDRFFIFFIPVLTPAVYWLALYYIYKLAKQYSTGNVFSYESIQSMRKTGLLLLSTDFVYMFQVAITGPLLSGLGLTENFIIIELKLGVSIVGLFIILISRIMLLASKLNEQQQLTI